MLRNARPVAATRESKQTIRYRGAAEGSDVTYSLIPEGVEDRVYFTARPASERLVYEISLMHVSGLRKIRNVLEFLDSTGTPRLRVNPPFVVDRNGRHDATLEVYGCEVDEDPRPPWGRALRAPGSQHCELHVAWHGVEYPAMVDPEWVETAAPTLLLGYHSATLLRNGRVLITNTNGAADLFDPTTRTFAATGSMTKPFGGSIVTLLGVGPNAGKALVFAGTATANLYDPTAGTFSEHNITMQSPAQPLRGAMTISEGPRKGQIVYLTDFGRGVELRRYDPAGSTLTLSLIHI